MRLIDADELRKCAIPCEIHNGALTELCIPLYQLDNTPTADDWQKYSDELWKNAYRKGKEDILQGEWKNKGLYYECSNCHSGYLMSITEKALDSGRFNYCPFCGADMRGEKNDE